MTEEQIREVMRRRPAVHHLCYGAYLQGPIWLQPDLFAVGLFPFGIKVYAEYVSIYVNELLDGRIGDRGVEEFSRQGRDALPGLTIIRFLPRDGTPEELQAQANESLDDARRALSWVTNDDPVPFAGVARTLHETFYWPIVPYARNLIRLGPGDSGPGFQDLVARLLEQSKADERLGFALSLFHDAVREENKLFRIARFFNCLECLAFRIKRALPSRKAVRVLMELEEGATMEVNLDGAKVCFDRIEVAGRMRDKLFHGVPFSPEDLNEESRPVFRLLDSNPGLLADAMMEDAWLALARWVNGASRGLTEYRAEGDPAIGGGNDS